MQVLCRQHMDLSLGFSIISKMIFAVVYLAALLCFILGFLDNSVGKESACNAGDLGSSLGWEDPLEEGTATHSSILAWRISWVV